MYKVSSSFKVIYFNNIKAINAVGCRHASQCGQYLLETKSVMCLSRGLYSCLVLTKGSLPLALLLIQTRI